LLRCYAATVRNPLSDESVVLPLRVGARVRRVRMRASDIYIIAEIFRERQYRLARPLPPRPCIVDAGANIGIASTWFLLLHPDARILAVEPVSQNLALLEANLATDAEVTVVKAALGAREGRVAMVMADSPAEHVVATQARGEPGESVPCHRLDQVMDEHRVRRIDLLKLDVEGSELAVLEGLGARIGDVGAIVAEVHERLIDVDAYYRFLEANAFVVVRRDQYREGEQHGVHTMEAWRRDLISSSHPT
jgi:FkbM family methyltransferase